MSLIHLKLKAHLVSAVCVTDALGVYQPLLFTKDEPEMTLPEDYADVVLSSPHKHLFVVTVKEDKPQPIDPEALPPIKIEGAQAEDEELDVQKDENAETDTMDAMSDDELINAYLKAFGKPPRLNVTPAGMRNALRNNTQA